MQLGVAFLSLRHDHGRRVFKHHLKVVSNTITSARSTVIAINALGLLNFDLPYDYPLQVPYLTSLSESLRHC